MMKINKENIINNICYTELVYGRINKKLNLNLTTSEIEKMILKILSDDNSVYDKQGKNYYVTNELNKTRITINSYTYRVITADRLK